MPSSSLCGSAPPRPAPVLWCLARPAVPQCRRCLLAARPRACKPVRTKGRRRRPSIFCMIFHLTRARAVGSAWCRLEATTPYYAKPAVESAWEHEPSLSSHDATASLSLLRKKDDFAKLRRGEDGQHGRCTCPKWISEKEAPEKIASSSDRCKPVYNCNPYCVHSIVLIQIFTLLWVLHLPEPTLD
ncbi:hypothetical protein BDA96_01G479700 [Sorghum bicolor]|uniref:Uncharacterized protein n=2 Tax=Sorghum bicolor TaxID=4558 RepID=A0A1B6QPJ2_SORBI|nr:uncharacterized protein LOC110433591 isoform X2 [Sorghum bicolor]KAG0552099.1 hypothetical protein BDA96_01G479700 [Sorghum bicolor]KXG39839.1 hypothetical protein SORBI_3001G450200 [Sorghum bicolor]|eukprot:XP_021311726.1 uncharacterized protein LOC110433591 isoform X2 [Sorghum bicolor]